MYVHQQSSRITNACIALFYNRRIYLVQERNSRLWNIPGGGIHRGKGENSFDAAFREFREETGGFDLKGWANSRNPRKEFHPFIYNGHTKIWWHVSNENISINFRQNRETIAGAWFDIGSLPLLRDVAQKSIPQLLTHMGHLL